MAFQFCRRQRNNSNTGVMGKFLTPLKVEEVSRGGLFRRARYQLIEPLIYLSNTVGLIIVDERQETDFDSTPRIPVFYWLLGDRGKAAAVLHDYLYGQRHERIAETGLKVDRLTADKVLRGATYECLRIDNPESLSDSLINIVCLGIAWAIWAGVRLGGWAHWK